MLPDKAKDWAEELDNNIRRRLKRAGLVKSGRLLRSIKTDVSLDNGDVVLRTYMEEYGLILNERSPFLDESFQEFKDDMESRIEGRIWKDIQQIIDNK